MTVTNPDPGTPVIIAGAPPLDDNRQKIKTAHQIAVADILFTTILSLVFISFAVNRNQWQFFLFAGVTLSGIGASALSVLLAARKKLFPSVLVTVLFWCIFCVTIAAFTSGVGLVVSASVIIIGILIAAETLNNRQTSVIIVLCMISGAGVLTANNFINLPRLNLPFTFILFPGILAGLIIAYIIQMSRRFDAYSLQVKLMAVFFAIALVPMGVVAALFNNTLTSIVNQKTQDALMIGATQTASSVDEFLTASLTDIRTAAQIPTFAKFLTQDGGSPGLNLIYVNDVGILLDSLREKDFFNIRSYAILDQAGHNVYDTNDDFANQDESSQPYFKSPMQTGQTYMSPVLFSPVNGRPSIYFSALIKSAGGNPLGVIRVQYDASVLQQIINQYNSFLGPHSYPILLDENMIRIGDSLTPENLYKSIVPLDANQIHQLQSENRLARKPAQELSTNIPALASAVQRSIQQPFFTAQILPELNRMESGAVTKTKTRNWTVVYMQDQAIFLAPITHQTQILILLASLVAALVTVIAIGLAFLLSRPIQALTDISIQVSAGDLSARAKVNSTDEIGVLGKAFNTMTAQLQSLISNLEKRVEERTHDLAVESERNRYRATQLQTVADVARAITTVQDLEALLTSVTRLINERFGFYHVGIFLLDEKKEYAVLRAANSTGGQRMLARAHRLKVGQVGIVGYVTGKGEPRIATDVGADAVFFNNPDLPETRSEMALPLLAGGQIIGALDVQSTESNAFSDEDVELFKTLADQVAIAIENNRLFAETREALLEMQKLHRQYLQQEWSRETAERKIQAVRYTRGGVFVQKPIEIPEIQQVFHSGEVIAHGVGPSQTTESKPALAVPIKLRDEVIGVIDFQDANQSRNWSEEEITLVKKVADQIGVALENVRLFEQTVRRAERERKVLEITGKIRATNDPQAILQTAVQELQKALNASRAQIIMKQSAETAEETQAATDRGSNGHHPDEN